MLIETHCLPLPNACAKSNSLKMAVVGFLDPVVAFPGGEDAANWFQNAGNLRATAAAA